MFLHLLVWAIGFIVVALGFVATVHDLFRNR